MYINNGTHFPQIRYSANWQQK